MEATVTTRVPIVHIERARGDVQYRLCFVGVNCAILADAINTRALATGSSERSAFVHCAHNNYTLAFSADIALKSMHATEAH